MPQPKYQLWRCSAYRRAMASGAASSRSDSEPAARASWELVRVQEGQAGSSRVQDARQIVAARSANPSLSPLARFQSRRFSPCRRCLASGVASSRGAAQPATDTSTTSKGDSKSQPTWSSEHQRLYYYHEDTRAPRYYRQCLKPCRTIVRDWPCHNPCVLRKTMMAFAAAHITVSCAQMASFIR